MMIVIFPVDAGAYAYAPKLLMAPAPLESSARRPRAQFHPMFRYAADKSFWLLVPFLLSSLLCKAALFDCATEFRTKPMLAASFNTRPRATCTYGILLKLLRFILCKSFHLISVILPQLLRADITSL